jgi:hypothetical protein
MDLLVCYLLFMLLKRKVRRRAVDCFVPVMNEEGAMDNLERGGRLCFADIVDKEGAIVSAAGRDLEGHARARRGD